MRSRARTWERAAGRHGRTTVRVRDVAPKQVREVIVEKRPRARAWDKKKVKGEGKGEDMRESRR